MDEVVWILRGLKMAPGKMRHCHDCGQPMRVRPGVVRPLCRGCRKKHHPAKKTSVIVSIYKKMER